MQRQGAYLSRTTGKNIESAVSYIAVAASSGTYAASLGAMTDAHARLGEIYAANAAMRDYARLHTRLVLTGAGPGAIVLAGGRRLVADASFDMLGPGMRLLYLPSFQVADPDRLDSQLRGMDRFHQWLYDLNAAGTLIGACGASVVHLAAAGLLTGQTISLHPRIARAFGKMYPDVAIEPVQTVRISGHLMSCGVDAQAAELVLRLIGAAFSPATANAISQREPIRSTGEPPGESYDPIVVQAQSWIADRFTSAFRIADMARDIGVSYQTLVRHFHAVGAGTPRAMVQCARIRAAASMLVETRRSVTEIAQLVGYSDISSFRSVFAEIVGDTPSNYRRTARRADTR